MCYNGCVGHYLDASNFDDHCQNYIPQLTQGSGMDLEKGLSTVPLRRRLWWFGPLVSPIFLQALTLTFLAEWGDRSQLTTIILGASEVRCCCWVFELLLNAIVLAGSQLTIMNLKRNGDM